MTSPAATTETAKEKPRSYQKHGLTTLKKAVNKLGARAIDQRTSVGKTLIAWRNDLVADLGGREALSTQRAALVDVATTTKLMLDSIDAWILTQPSLVNGRKKALLPVVRERASLASSLQGLLTTLGLERKAREVASLQELLAKRPAMTESAPIDVSATVVSSEVTPAA